MLEEKKTFYSKKSRTRGYKTPVPIKGTVKVKVYVSACGIFLFQYASQINQQDVYPLPSQYIFEIHNSSAVSSSSFSIVVNIS